MRRLFGQEVASVRVMTVSATSTAFDAKDFPTYLDALLSMRWDTNAAAARDIGEPVTASSLAKWRKGIVKPSIDSGLRETALALGIPPAHMFLRAGLLKPEDLEMPELYVRAAAVDAMVGEDERVRMRSMFELVLRGTETVVRLDEPITDH